MGKTVEALKKSCPNATFKAGGVVNGMSEAELKKSAQSQ